MTVIYLSEYDELTPDTPDRGSQVAGVLLGTDQDTKKILQWLSKKNILSIQELRTGLRIKATSYVGSIQLGDLQIVIQPKIEFDPLIKLFRYAYSLRDLNLHIETDHQSATSTFQDLLIQQLAIEVNNLMSRGLFRQYVRNHESLASPRGRIDIQEIAQKGGVIEASLPSIYYTRQENTLINQVVVAGLHLAGRLAQDPVLQTKIRRLIQLLEENVSSIRLNKDCFKKLSRQQNRLTTAYEPTITLIRLLFDASGLALDKMDERFPLPGFLFDMNRFFELLLRRFLVDNLRDYRVDYQHKLDRLMAYAADHNPQGNSNPLPRPDFAIFRREQLVALLDTKYRDIWTEKLPREMLYQLGVYALSQGFGGQSTILYPTMNSNACMEIIEIYEPLKNRVQAKVILHPINLARLEHLISAVGTQSELEREAFVLELIGANHKYN